MNASSIQILMAVNGGTTNVDALKEIIGVKDWQFNSLINDLTKQGYVIKDGKEIKFQEGPKAIIFRELAKKWDLEKLLHESNEKIISYLTEPISINAIETISGISRATIYRAISELESIGAIEKEGDVLSLNNTDEKLSLFANTLKIEREQGDSKGNIEILFKGPSETLTKVPKGIGSEGVLTAYSIFGDYGIEYHTVYDYYIEQEKPITIGDVLIHSIVAAKEANDKTGLVMSIVFYLKNKSKMDILNLREISKSFGVADIWTDIEGYLRGTEPKNAELFLPWNEFVEKAELYEISQDEYTLPSAYPSLFEEIGKKSPQKLRLYLFGGENMRIKGLKPRTKDCDIIVENENDFNSLINVLKELGYEPVKKTKFSEEDRRIYPDEILVHSEKRSRIDLFTKNILKDLSLSSAMRDTADILDYDNVKIFLLRNEYVFLLKSVASREGDIQDMNTLVQKNSSLPDKFQHGGFDWELIWNELVQQDPQRYNRNIAEVVLESLELLDQKTGIRAPFFEKLHRLTIDNQIRKQIRGGKRLLKNIVSDLKGGDLSEISIRNRIDALEREKNLEKQTVANQVSIVPIQKEVFPEGIWEINVKNLEIYLKWRFPLREESTPHTLNEFSEELNSFGYITIRQLDNSIIDALDVLTEYEKVLSENYFKNVGAARICIKLAMPSIENKKGYRVINYEGFKKMFEQATRKQLKVNA